MNNGLIALKFCTEVQSNQNQIKSKFISRHIAFKKFKCNNLQCTYNMSWGVA